MECTVLTSPTKVHSAAFFFPSPRSSVNAASVQRPPRLKCFCRQITPLVSPRTPNDDLHPCSFSAQCDPRLPLACALQLSFFSIQNRETIGKTFCFCFHQPPNLPLSRIWSPERPPITVSPNRRCYPPSLFLAPFFCKTDQARLLLFLLLAFDPHATPTLFILRHLQTPCRPLAQQTGSIHENTLAFLDRPRYYPTSPLLLFPLIVYVFLDFVAPLFPIWCFK